MGTYQGSVGTINKNNVKKTRVGVCSRDKNLYINLLMLKFCSVLTTMLRCEKNSHLL